MSTKKVADPQASQDKENLNSNANVNTMFSKKPLGKIDRVLFELRRGISLNRFDAERLGDHCLNTTISTLRAEGWLIASEWETVPTRFGKTARVLRYRLTGYRNPAEVTDEIAAILGEGRAT
ncbi:helix-turn-helix domain protein [Burkholderia pseudomallei]|uniref:helix-turn-helix domain-containing protein n=1 Tax=Burkholderia pseudomallei TaxID=28450 RepID=UPI000F1E19F6|nr:helix-turn-helix domain-containing protein [Burkholderia pseudomallei]CAJ3765446.1 helix-turn-helix domain protein [Burkholderia pseudomallei]CAJ4236640.1 helix-turn-helix domain protein [Burkholderia pseudomallei]CAJ5588950.1 helix-turn-helix domain protein [Burkholderia pseudomallei]CAJ5597359.1 helix-turn-helix domain protein [Burkholderia pseudomallei]CAJ6866910.1 helix-turn-helix domain protein [Burkholderia pseudomallei]